MQGLSGSTQTTSNIPVSGSGQIGAQVVVSTGSSGRVIVTPLVSTRGQSFTTPQVPPRNSYSEIFSYRVKIINQSRRKESIVRDVRKFHSRFSSIIDLKVKLMEEFEECVPPTTQFSVGYFIGRQSTKKWLVTQEDLAAMYSELRQIEKTNVCLWCDRCEVSENSRKCKREVSPGHTSKRAQKEGEIDDMVAELKEIHRDKHSFSDPQYRLWARMIINGIHSSKQSPPQVPMITGVTSNRPARRSMDETVANAVAAVVKGMGPAQPLQAQVQQSVLAASSQLTSIQNPTSLAAISPGKAVEIRGKCFSQLASLKQLYKDSVLKEEELKEQKSSILETLRKI